MKSEIKIKKLVWLAFGLSLAINFSEILYYFNSPITLFETPRPTSVLNILFRGFSVFLFCFSALYFNIFKIDAWLRNLTDKMAFLGSLLINGLLYILTLIPFLYIMDNFIVTLPLGELKGLSFVWLVLLVICVLLATLLKVRSGLANRLIGQEAFVRYNKEHNSFDHDLNILEKNYLTSLLLPRKKVLEPVKIKDFALFFIEDCIVKGKTFDLRVFFLDKSIQELEQKLNPNSFFRANRQCLINRDAVKHLEPDSFGKMELTLKIDHEESISISKLKTKDFKDWLVEFSA
ncbi:LytTR family transcriptional regulator [Aggregatimonas sangjinii]|uniref:LytTR family transcriptional regulator n=1 Tax=Aggregatimonas sangjinii TaxID=2583587 RepID=A0A5B7SUC1_9FLAO|nr:LytTR family DNA-binding domain-containing protein [Aggregatimonas sangjinii]QCX00618.1 LytTR family transcriptional regulator [Aggregatimonas sangjinii]